MKNVVLIGCGSIAKYVYNAVLKTPSFKLTAVCDLNIHKANMLAKDEIQKFTDYKEMLNKVKCDIVILLTHHSNREGILKYLLENNYIVLCEKPLIWNREQIGDLKNIFNLYNNYPFTMYHRTANRNVQKAMDYCENHSVEKIEINYLEDIRLHTSETENIYLSDDKGGGCINDNFPNCVHFLLSKGLVSFVDAEGEVDFENKLTKRAKINLIWNGIPCIVNLDWYSKIDLKSINIYTASTRKVFDMQENYKPGKDSLNEEYFNILSELETYNTKREFSNAIKIFELMNNAHNLIYKAKVY